ncbi:hypothetical protein PMAYCL1PPCAC_25594, partial [Pristionchus mayeri]
SPTVTSTLLLRHSNEATADAASHSRFPVTPVYKMFNAGIGDKIPLSRLAMFQAASKFPTATEVDFSADNSLTINDECVDTSVYATPPESNSPASIDDSRASPRKFPEFRSLI